MQSCESCIHKTTDITVRKMWQCKEGSTLSGHVKRFDNPKLHGWICPAYQSEDNVNDKINKISV